MRSIVRRRGWAAAAPVVAALALVAAELGSALPQPLGVYLYGPNMARAEAVLRIGTTDYSYRVDRGRVRAITETSITLRERDSLVVTIPVAADARIQLNGRTVFRLLAVRLGMEAVTVRQGDAPAETVLAAGRGHAGFRLPQPLVNYLFGPNMLRTEVVLKLKDALHDYRVDRGKVRAVTATSLTLKERDGLIVTIPVSATARVQMNGRRVRLAALRRGMEAMTVRDGNDPADTVQAPPRK